MVGLFVVQLDCLGDWVVVQEGQIEVGIGVVDVDVFILVEMMVEGDVGDL